MENTRRTSFAVLCHPQLFVVKCISNHGERKHILRCSDQLGRLIQWLPSIISLRANLPLFPHPDWIIIKKQPLRLPRLSATRWCLLKCPGTTRSVCPSDNAVRSDHGIAPQQTAGSDAAWVIEMQTRMPIDYLLTHFWSMPFTTTKKIHNFNNQAELHWSM